MSETRKFLTAGLSSTPEDDFNKIKIVANAGSVMEFPDGDVVLDIDRLTIAKHSNAPPILHSHDWQRPIGHFLNCSIEDGAILVEASLSCANKDVDEVKASLKNGFPWQASLGFSLTDYETYDKGEKFSANGQDYTAENKTYLATGIEVWECSVVLFGADGATSVVKAKQQPKEEIIMAEELKQATTETAPAIEAKATPTPDFEAQARAAAEKIREAELKECARIDALKKLADQYEAQTKLADAIKAGTDAPTFELEVLRASYGKAPAVQVKAEESSMENKSEVFKACAIRHAGLTPKGFSDKVLEAADKYQYHDFRDLFEALTGYQPTYDARRQGDIWTAGASTYHLDSLLVDAGNAIMLQAFDLDFQDGWRKIFKVTSVSDFKTVDRWRVGADVEFKELANGGEMTHFTADDYKFQIQAGVYARQGEVTYQDLINGQFLDVFGEIMRRFAQGAIEAINKKCWTLFLNPSTGFYSASHQNLRTNSALTYANLGAATTAYQIRKRGFGADADAYLSVRPTKLIVPAELEWTANLITKAGTWSPAASTVADYNPARNYGFDVITIPQLSDATFGGNYSGTTWYLSNDANRLAAYEIAFLNGKQAPALRQQDLTIGRLGIAFDGHIDFGVAEEDYRGMMQCTA